MILYWQQGGNPDLRPENAYQYELGQEIRFQTILISATAFLNKIKDLIGGATKRTRHRTTSLSFG
jgi:iron complex outermembrane receptor protein